ARRPCTRLGRERERSDIRSLLASFSSREKGAPALLATRRSWLEPVGDAVEGEEVRYGFAGADDVPAGAVDEDFGDQWAGIVGGGHDGAIGAGAHDGEQVAFLDTGNGAAAGEIVASFADRADNVAGD